MQLFALIRRVLVPAVVVALLGAAEVLPRAAAQEKPTLKPFYYGAPMCSGRTGCHGDKEPVKDTKSICRCIEATIWEQKDKHRLAYDTLTGARGQAMGKLLGMDVTDPQKGCVACHGVIVPAGATVHEKSFNKAEGVTCVVCHGAHAEWVDEHASVTRLEKFRVLPREIKEKDYGMTDLWHADKRARVCASCHIGNTGERKVVTHAMYAAGHPPLPGFEIATFSEEMPRHWQYPREKSEEVQKIQNFSKEFARFEQTRLVLIGGVASFRESLRLLGSQAEECAKASDTARRVLDFAQFDCYACHHELRTPSWRQTRGYPGPPGRLSMRPWPTTLVRVALRQQGRQASEMDTQLRKLAGAFTERPFGNVEKIAAEARALETWSEGLLKAVENEPIDVAGACRVLEELASFAEEEYPDFDAARERAWAFLIVFGELKEKPYTDELKQPAGKKLDMMLDLRLPPRKGNDPQIFAGLPKRLECMTNYDPIRFRLLFGEVAQALVKK